MRCAALHCPVLSCPVTKPICAWRGLRFDFSNAVRIAVVPGFSHRSVKPHLTKTKQLGVGSDVLKNPSSSVTPSHDMSGANRASTSNLNRNDQCKPFKPSVRASSSLRYLILTTAASAIPKAARVGIMPALRCLLKLIQNFSYVMFGNRKGEVNVIKVFQVTSISHLAEVSWSYEAHQANIL
jgi:hypothetical protein